MVTLLFKLLQHIWEAQQRAPGFFFLTIGNIILNPLYYAMCYYKGALGWIVQSVKYLPHKCRSLNLILKIYKKRESMITCNCNASARETDMGGSYLFPAYSNRMQISSLDRNFAFKNKLLSNWKVHQILTLLIYLWDICPIKIIFTVQKPIH